MRNWCVSITECLFRGTELRMNVFAWTNSIMCRCVLETFTTQMHPKRGQTSAFPYPNARFWGLEVRMKVFAGTHPIALSRAKIIFGNVLEALPTRMHAKRWQPGLFRYPKPLFRGTEIPTNVFARTHPIASIRPKMIFGRVLKPFATRMHPKRWEIGAFR